MPDGPRQAFPEKAIQPKGMHEKETAPLQTTAVFRTQQDLNNWETFLQAYNGITISVDNHMTTAGERGIHVTTSPDGWRVEKGGQFVSGSWPKALSTRSAATGASLLPWLMVAKARGMPLRTQSW